MIGTALRASADSSTEQPGDCPFRKNVARRLCAIIGFEGRRSADTCAEFSEDDEHGRYGGGDRRRLIFHLTEKGATRHLPSTSSRLRISTAVADAAPDGQRLGGALGLTTTLAAAARRGRVLGASGRAPPIPISRRA